ncbi:SUMF1/EgtB/PvdO family nonheme iron enzyme [Myxococcota bacterium]|nr:SUMF1/EgtB/PvdO family nonheme iron enzyme [Myxococcota bacterium]
MRNLILIAVVFTFALIACDDGGGGDPAVEICNNAADDDGDGLFDCDDPDCAGYSGCQANNCTPECEEGESQCAGGAMLQVCALVQGCNAWVDDTDCDSLSQVCQVNGTTGNAECVATCQNVCLTVGDTRCSNNIVQTCTLQGTGCLDWEDTENCTATSQSCSTVSGDAACINEITCGDGIAQTPVEECDGTDLHSETCVSLGYYGGTLSCRGTCEFNLDSCETFGRCSDGEIQDLYGEECEGVNLNGASCESLGYYGGQLFCGGDCRFDLTQCEASGRCGDGVIHMAQGEECDGSNLSSQTCLTLGYGQESGALGCMGCMFDETACVPKNTNADLSSLTVSAGTLTPAFTAGTTSYAVTVLTSVTTLTVAATKADTYASVNITPAQPMTLTLGDNPATVTVTAESGASKEYMVTVIRLSPNDLSSPNIGMLKYVPAGTFQRDSTPTNLSMVTEFRMSQHEITRAQWTAVTGWADPSDVTVSSGTGDPVQQVNWYDAIAFCNKLSLLEGLTPVYTVSGVDFTTLTYAQIPAASNATWNEATANWSANGYRLPTEAEWMWAAMGADTENPGVTNTTGYLKAFAGSTGSNAIGDYAWYSVNSTSKTHPAGTKLPNELGLYDLSGNVFELAWDWYGTYPTGTQTDYRGAASGVSRVIRGGYWGGPASYCTVAVRYGYGPFGRDDGIGFRVVRP